MRRRKMCNFPTLNQRTCRLCLHVMHLSRWSHLLTAKPPEFMMHCWNVATLAKAPTDDLMHRTAREEPVLWLLLLQELFWKQLLKSYESLKAFTGPFVTCSIFSDITDSFFHVFMFSCLCLPLFCLCAFPCLNSTSCFILIFALLCVSPMTQLIFPPALIFIYVLSSLVWTAPP